MLKQFVAFILTLCIACTTAAKVPHHIAPPSPADMELYRSIARVSIQAGGSTLTATAFAISDKFLITAGHVCADAQALAVDERVPAELKADYIDDEDLVAHFDHIQMIKVDAVNDLCMLLAPGHPLKPLEIEQDPRKVKRFDRIYMAGSPYAEFPMLEDCFVSSRDSEDQADPDSRGWLSSSCHAQPGYSGGPLVRAGKVVSVVSRGKALLWPIVPGYLTFGCTTASLLEFVKFIK